MLCEPKSGERPIHTQPRSVCDIRHNRVVTSNLAFHRELTPICKERLRTPPSPATPLRRRRAFLCLFRHVLPDFAVLAPEKQQRIAFANHHVLNFRNKDGVVAGLLRRL